MKPNTANSSLCDEMVKILKWYPGVILVTFDIRLDHLHNCKDDAF